MLCVNLCLFVCFLFVSKRITPIFMYVCGRFGHSPKTNPLHFGWICLGIGWIFYKNLCSRNEWKKCLIALIILILYKSLIFTNKLNLLKTMDDQKIMKWTKQWMVGEMGDQNNGWSKQNFKTIDHSHCVNQAALRAVLKPGDMSSSPQATQILVRFVCVYASFYRHFQSFFNRFRSFRSLF